ncbi:MAG: Rieske (2Fe-2S) iron-sulfur domain protein [Thermoleophilia bacterium]|nr:Rieske (2Fe-2S) iron-sulfur domain protein [Thermoleophilia bacterium]
MEPDAPTPTPTTDPVAATSDPEESAARSSRGRSSADPERRDIMRWNIGTLHQAWYAACQSKDLVAGKPLARTLLEEPIVLFRAADGTATALIDRCLHRNAALSKGKVSDGCISCPYHGWKYDAEGVLVRVPSEGAGGERKRLRAERFPVREQEGLVWVWMGDPEAAATVEPFRMPIGGAEGWKHYYMYTDFDGDVTDLAENFMDVPHTAFVHAGWFRSESKHEPKRAEADVVRTHDAVHVTYHQEDDTIGFSERFINPDGAPMTHTDRFYMPNTTRVDYLWGERRGFVISSTITPVSPTRAMVFTSIAYRFGFLNPIARLFLPWYTRVVINQDVDIMEVQTGTLERFGRRRFFGTEADVIHRSIELLREHRLNGEVGVPPKRLEKRIEFWM